MDAISKNGVDKAAELATGIFTQLTSLLEEVAGSSMNVFGCENTDLNKLATRRLVVAQQLQSILTNTPLSDPLLQPLETPLTVPQFLDELSREHKELEAALQNVDSNKEHLSTLLEHARKRDENLFEIIKGVAKETVAIEDEDPHVQLENMERLKKRVMRSFNTILDCAYPALKADIKHVLEELASWNAVRSYMPIPENVNPEAINVLVMAKIIEMDDDFQKIKLLVPTR